MLQRSELKIAVIGLGYIGLPLAVEFGKQLPVVGFDIQQKRIQELQSGQDHTLEVSQEELKQAMQLTCFSNLDDLNSCNFFIVTVPTPIDEFKQPNLIQFIKASTSIGKVLKKDDVVGYKSTVYSGATEEDCISVLEQMSGSKFNEEFFAGYSPERINSGDKLHRVTNILKVTSGSTLEVADFVDVVYQLIVTAGTHKAASIKVADAAKVIENTQRDVNIALINELAVIFNKLGIDTEAVLKAAGTKWTFLPFHPGLVGEHYIGLVPYYLTHKAPSLGLHLEIILAARRLNNCMREYFVTQLIKEIVKQRIQVIGSKILVIGLSFKEDCPDIQNTEIIDIFQALKEYGLDLDIYDPWTNLKEMEHEYSLATFNALKINEHDVIALTVAQDQFKQITAAEIHAIGKSKYVFDLSESSLRL